MQILTKLLLIFLLAELKLCKCVTIYDNPKGIYDFGERTSGDQILATATLIEKPFPGEVVYAQLSFDASKTKGVIKTIDAIKIRPQAVSDFVIRPARLEIISGGIGEKKVEIRLYSEKGFGINYKVEIWGVW